MIDYSLNGAWGNTIPDQKLKEALADLGIFLDVEARRDGLTNVKISIDDAKILNRRKRSASRKKENSATVAKNADAKATPSTRTSKK